MRVLGVDPGTAITGFGVVEQQGHRVVCREWGVIRTPAGQPLSQRLARLYAEIQGVFDRHAVEAVSVEQLFFNRNARTALAVGHARGVVLLAAALAGIDVAEYTPPQVKQAVTGVGSASKEQVGFMISRLLNLPAPPRPDDAADALAVALCHLQHGRTIARWAREGGA